MENLVILTNFEQEFLLRAIESGLHVHKLRQFFLWTQGQFQALLPHQVMVCIQFGPVDEVLEVECLHSTLMEQKSIERLCNAFDGLVIRMARHYRGHVRLPFAIGDQSSANEFSDELEEFELHNVLLHGTERLRGGSSFFALFRLPHSPTLRDAFFIELLLPHLHLAFMRLVSGAVESTAITDRLHGLTVREIEVLTWLTEGKSNQEIGAILTVSPHTVKNHLQKIYKKLKVQNRVQAVSRGHAMRILAIGSWGSVVVAR